MKRIDFKMLLGALGSIAIGVGMITGDVQQYIGFADPWNEIIFTAMCFMGGLGFMFNIKK